MEKKIILYLILFVTIFQLQFCSGEDQRKTTEDAVKTTAPLTIPEVLKTSPSAGETDVLIATTIQVTFSKIIKPSSLNNTSFLVYQNNNPINGKIFVINNIASFKPDESLLYDTNYKIVLTTAITDLLGKAISDNYSWQFQTEIDQNSNPGLISKTPAAGEINLSVRPVISVEFNKEIDSSTITNSSFSLYNGSDYIIASYTFSNDRYYLVLASDLDFDSSYTLTLNTEIKDIYGNSLNTNTSWNFTTNNGTITDPYETDNFVADASALSVNEARQAHSIYPKQDVDWISFTVSSVSDSYYIQTDSPDASCTQADTQISLYDKDKTTFIQGDDDGGSGYCSSIIYKFSSTGTYYIKIDSYYPSDGDPIVTPYNTGAYYIKIFTGTAPSYTIGGTVNGLNGTLVLQNNLGDDLSVSANGSFVFSNELSSGNSYNTTVKTHPAGQNCTVNSASGTVSSSNIDSILIACADGAPSGSLDLKLASFNIQDLGTTKMGRPAVKNILIQIAIRYDILVIQELSNKPDQENNTGPVIREFFSAMNSNSSDEYSMIVSPRVGLEQYVVIFKNQNISLLDQYVYNDSLDDFAREPYVVKLQVLGKNFYLVDIHTRPSDAHAEIVSLADVAHEIEAVDPDDRIIVLGDYNADGSYFNEDTQWPDLLLTGEGYANLITNGFNTTLSATANTYDRILISPAFNSAYTASSAKAFYFDNTSGETEGFSMQSVLTEGCTLGYLSCSASENDAAKKVSDHYPVEIILHIEP